MTYSPIVARPRSIFAKEYFLFQEGALKDYPAHQRYFGFLTNIGDGSGRRSVYLCDLKGIWQDHFPNMTFPEFKYQFHNGEGCVNLGFRQVITPVLQVKLTLKQNNADSFQSEVQQWGERLGVIFGKLAKKKTYFNTEYIATELQEKVSGLTKYAAEMMAHTLLESCTAYDRLMKQSSNFYNRFIAFDESRSKYHLLSSGYAGFIDWFVNETNNIFVQPNRKKVNDSEYEIYFPKVFASEQEKRFMYLGLMEALGLLLYRINGGDSPEIYIRIFSRLKLEQAISNPSRYRNIILDNVYKRHRLSVEMLSYLFENQVNTEQFWELIEDYFLGKVPEEVLQRL
jgi:ATP-dependent DNA helicase RecQ